MVSADLVYVSITNCSNIQSLVAAEVKCVLVSWQCSPPIAAQLDVVC